MKLKNNIKYVDDTANIVTGCSRVSEGCKNCYGAVDTPARVHRFNGRETWGANALRIPVAGFEAKIRRLNKLCVCDNCHETAPAMGVGTRCGIPDIGATEPDHCCQGRLCRIRCFADSNSDWLDDRWPIETLARFLKAIHDAPNVDFLLLTKRPKNFFKRLHSVSCWANDHPKYFWIRNWYRESVLPRNIWLGVSAENQEWWDKRIKLLFQIPAAQYYFSIEPLLGGINMGLEALSPVLRSKLWVVTGGESGPHARPCNVEWIRDIVRQCKTAGTACYVKQMGANVPLRHNDDPIFTDKKGGNMSEWPEDLRVRQMPNALAPGQSKG